MSPVWVVAGNVREGPRERRAARKLVAAHAGRAFARSDVSAPSRLHGHRAQKAPPGLAPAARARSLAADLYINN
ncbi:hypothetical protein Y033_3167 [Burkholderia pseudomallei MSHR435]|nr:hypothetical protein [Burkholderia pseudomallei]KGW86172.1 hypothetical protein Y034_3058 [Burkholderia pseudomallei MSHR449]KGX77540.1 hypothetical protein Y033_3167 [Burkholderia pseudomallei MSHR435]MCQ8214434.1 hypothetical protein [Burkholderia pseudomallei]